ncbi:MAG: hypothetical protein Q8936_14265 [Bacillota bacterium]|nr:hypothetical protein [Bacillota bacterium]
MNWFGSGFITIIIYGSSFVGPEEEFSLLTENGLNILTENGDDILVDN